MGKIENGHGGARSGAGRKSGGKNSVPRSAETKKTGRIVISCLESEAEQIKALAEKNGKTTSRFLLELALGTQ